jgi:type I restriction enzyme S subunit
MVEVIQVPLPPLSEQRRIAAILDKAEAIRRKREEGIRLTEELLRSTFLDMFGDPVSYPSHPLSQIAIVVSGVAKGRKLNGRAIDVPYLRVANVQDGYLSLDEIKTIEALPEEVEALTLRPGDIVLTEGGDHDKLGRGAVWTYDLNPNTVEIGASHSLLLP